MRHIRLRYIPNQMTCVLYKKSKGCWVWWQMLTILAFGRWRQGNQKFIVILSSTVGLRPSWGTHDPNSKQKQTNPKEQKPQQNLHKNSLDKCIAQKGSEELKHQVPPRAVPVSDR